MEERKQAAEKPGRPWSVCMADAVIQRAVPFRWHYEYGLVNKAIEQVWMKTGEERYFNYIHDEISPFIAADGSILTYSAPEFNLDQVYPGRLLFMLYRVSGEERYRKALDSLRNQLRWQPRTHAGGFWHKLIYPYQMWLDGFYMASPFYAEYARTFKEPQAYEDIVHQARLIETNTRDPQSGLYYHGWDESRLQRWANPDTGCSAHFWDRAMGWFAMGLLDVLDYLPENHPGAGEIQAIFRRCMNAAYQVQDPASGVWFQVMDQGARAGNYLEASGSCMFVYAAVKGVRLGYLPAEFSEKAKRGYRGILQQFVRVGEDGLANLDQICAVAGLGGSPYRDGTYGYYVNEKAHSNDYKGVGPFILAALEIEAQEGSEIGISI